MRHRPRISHDIQDASLAVYSAYMGICRTFPYQCTNASVISFQGIPKCLLRTSRSFTVNNCGSFILFLAVTGLTLSTGAIFVPFNAYALSVFCNRLNFTSGCFSLGNLLTLPSDHLYHLEITVSTQSRHSNRLPTAGIRSVFCHHRMSMMW